MVGKWDGTEVNLPEDQWPYSFKKWLTEQAPAANKKAIMESSLSLLTELYAAEYDEWFDIRIRIALRKGGVNLA